MSCGRSVPNVSSNGGDVPLRGASARFLTGLPGMSITRCQLKLADPRLQPCRPPSPSLPACRSQLLSFHLPLTWITPTLALRPDNSAGSQPWRNAIASEDPCPTLQTTPGPCYKSPHVRPECPSSSTARGADSWLRYWARSPGKPGWGWIAPPQSQEKAATWECVQLCPPWASPPGSQKPRHARQHNPPTMTPPTHTQLSNLLHFLLVCFFRGRERLILI